MPAPVFPLETSLAALRAELVARVRNMPAGQLRQLAEELATIRDERDLEDWERDHLASAPAGARVIRYPGQRIRLSTDPPELPPYGPQPTVEEFEARLAGADAEVEEGRGVGAEELLTELRRKTA